MKTLAERVVEGRNRREWTQERLAHEAGVSSSAVYRIEAGKTRRGAAVNSVLRVLSDEGTKNITPDDAVAVLLSQPPSIIYQAIGRLTASVSPPQDARVRLPSGLIAGESPHESGHAPNPGTRGVPKAKEKHAGK